VLLCVQVQTLKQSTHIILYRSATEDQIILESRTRE
jgi:hypothetical protein